MRKHFGVSFASEGATLLLEISLERGVVLDDAVVNDHDAVTEFTVVTVRVSVQFSHAAVGCPARVTDAHRAFETAAIGDRLLNIRDAPDGSREMHAAIHDGNARGVVAAILHALEAFEENVGGLSASDVSDDSAHS